VEDIIGSVLVIDGKVKLQRLLAWQSEALTWDDPTC
jgi:hypothetical protein